MRWRNQRNIPSSISLTLSRQPPSMPRRFLGLATFLLTLVTGAFSQTPELVPARGGSPPPDEFVRQWFTIRSSILGETRHIVVALPPSFPKTRHARRYPVAVIFDEE